jgi:hypothetical protein
VFLRAPLPLLLLDRKPFLAHSLPVIDASSVRLVSPTDYPPLTLEFGHGSVCHLAFKRCAFLAASLHNYVICHLMLVTLLPAGPIKHELTKKDARLSIPFAVRIPLSADPCSLVLPHLARILESQSVSAHCDMYSQSQM